MVAAMEHLLPRMVGSRAQCKIINHRSKQRLLTSLPGVLRGYANMPGDVRILVLVDRDDDDCRALKKRLETAARDAGLPTKSHPSGNGRVRVVNRIVIQELEAWFFGDPAAVDAAYANTRSAFARAAYRNPDTIPHTWEALQGILRHKRHLAPQSKLPKIGVARAIATHMDPNCNLSPSFQAFRQGLDALLAV